MNYERETSKKIDRAIKLLKSIPSDDIEVCFSGGKDSSAILELAKMAGIKYTPIYKNTTIDPPGNIAFCKSMGCEIIRPKLTFFELIQKYGFPTRRVRFCCGELKEYKIKDYAIVGVRRAESRARMERYHEPEECRIYGNGGRKKKDGSNYCRLYYPILDWTNEDVKEFVIERKIKLNPIYYENGQIDVNKRLGCMCCPLKGLKQLQADFEAHPRMVKLYIRNGLIWWNKDRKKELANKKRYSTFYDLFFQNVFCQTYQDYLEKKHGLFGDLDCKRFLEEHFKIKLD